MPKRKLLGGRAWEGTPNLIIFKKIQKLSKLLEYKHGLLMI